MKRTFTFLTIVALGLWVSDAFTNSSVAPANHTGAPGESNCTNCHGGTLNPNLADVQLLENGAAFTEYIPGTTYNLTLRIVEPAQRFGFSLVARKGTAQAGQIILSEPNRTFLQNASSRQYISHSSGGIIPTATNTGSWNFQWTAPVQGTGEIVMYASLNAANGNGNTAGDKIYTRNFPINESNPANAKIISWNPGLNVFPNPASNFVNIHFEVDNTDIYTAFLFDVQGRKVANVLNQSLEMGTQSVQVPTENLAKGMYFLHLSNKGRVLTQKIAVN